MIDRLETDTAQLMRVGAQSADGKAAYVQMYLAGNMGEALANESTMAVQNLVAGLTPPPGVNVFVTGGSALQADQQPSQPPRRVGRWGQIRPSQRHPATHTAGPL